MTWCCVRFLERALELKNPFYLIPNSHQPWDSSFLCDPREALLRPWSDAEFKKYLTCISLHPLYRPSFHNITPISSVLALLIPASKLWTASSSFAPIFQWEQWELGIQHRAFCSAVQSVTTGSTSLALVCCFINTFSSHQVSRIKTSFWNMGAWQVLSRRPDILNPVSVRFSSQQRRHTLFWWCGAKWLLGQCWSLEISLSGGLMTEFFWPEGNR